MFPVNILSTLSIGAIGVHGSAEFLPFGRGRSPINWSIIENRKRFIFHYFLLKPGIDDGDVFHYQSVDINEWDDCYTLYLKNSILTFKVLKEFIPHLLAGSYNISEQKGNATYYPKRTPEMSRIDWKKDVFEIYNFIRAQTKPYPGAFCYLNDAKLTIWKAQPFDTRIDVPESIPGEIIFIDLHGGVVIKVIGGLLLITEYESEKTLLIGNKLV